MKNALIVAAHPDDAELGMGGTIAKMTESGWNVTVVDLTNGEPTPLGTKRIRSRETRKASGILGVSKRICLKMPNRYLELTLKNRRKLAEVIRLTKADLLFGPAIPDRHPDHIAVARLLESARFEAKFQKSKMSGSAHWVPRHYFYGSIHKLEYEKPSFIVDISGYWDKKLEAIKAYKSQLRNIYPGNEFSIAEKIETVCRYFGQCIGVRYGEPFTSSEPIYVRNLDFLVDFVSIG